MNHIKSYSQNATYTSNGRIDTPSNISRESTFGAMVKEWAIGAGIIFAAVQIVLAIF